MFSIYIHIPFCLNKCNYCSFNSHSFSELDVEPRKMEREYVDAVICEFHKQLRELNLYDETVATLYFGGGTPSIFSGESIEKIIGAIKSCVAFAADIEITIEANPATITREKLLTLRQIGVNRISLGVQSLRDEKLQFLGRIHSVGDAMVALEYMRNVGDGNVCAGNIDAENRCDEITGDGNANAESGRGNNTGDNNTNISVDLIFGSALDSPESLREELRQIVAEKPQHISIYGLSIDEGSRFYDQCCAGRREKTKSPYTCNDDDYAIMYRLIQHELTTAGYNQYEISNFAIPGYESKHNITYWNCGGGGSCQCGPHPAGSNYIGLGAGASSYFTTKSSHTRWTNIKHPLQYISAAHSDSELKEYSEILSTEQRKTEFVFLGLRQRAGIELERYKELFQEDFCVSKRSEIEKLRNNGMLVLENGFCKIPPDQFVLADGIIEQLLCG